MRSRVFGRLILLVLLPALLFGPASLAIGGGRATDAQSPAVVGDNAKEIQDAIKSGREITVIVQLVEPPLTTYTGGIRGIGTTKPAKGKKLDRKSINALGYARFLEERRGAFKAFLRSVAGSAVVEGEYDTTLNGLAITLSGRDLQRVLNGPGVKSVSVDREFTPLMNRSREIGRASCRERV